MAMETFSVVHIAIREPMTGSKADGQGPGCGGEEGKVMTRVGGVRR